MYRGYVINSVEEMLLFEHRPKEPLLLLHKSGFHTLIFFKGTKVCVCALFSPARVLYQKPVSLRVLCSILAVPRTALLWTEASDVSPGICCSHCSSVGVIAPECSHYHRDHTRFGLPHLLQLFIQPLVLFNILLVLLASAGILLMIIRWIIVQLKMISLLLSNVTGYFQYHNARLMPPGVSIV